MGAALRCGVWASPAVASLVGSTGSKGTASAAGAPGRSGSVAWGIFRDQGLSLVSQGRFLNHWTAREAIRIHILRVYSFLKVFFFKQFH